MPPASPDKKISPNVLIMGWVSLFNDAASEMLYPIMPLFITSTLGASPAILGLIDGSAEGIGSALRWIGGALSDRFGRRKPFILAGYALSAISKPVMGLAAFTVGWPLFFLGRCSDRLGKAVRNAARDALIAASTDPASRGRAFGFQRAMDTCGAVIGPLITLAVIASLAGLSTTFQASKNSLPNLPLKWLFFVALIPGALAVLCVLLIKEIRPHKTSNGKPPPIFQSFPRPLWQAVAAVFVFSLGNSSDTFLILRSTQLGLTFGWVILLYVMYNIVYAAASQPLGALSDRIGRKPLLICGWLIYALVYAGFAFAQSAWSPWPLMAIYGLYQALTDGVTSALISDVVPDEKRAGAIGLYYTLAGLGQFTASLLAGSVFSVTLLAGHAHLAFALGSIFSLCAIPLLARVHLKGDTLSHPH